MPPVADDTTIDYYFITTASTMSPDVFMNIILISVILLVQFILIAILFTCCFIGHFKFTFQACCFAAYWVREVEDSEDDNLHGLDAEGGGFVHQNIPQPPHH